MGGAGFFMYCILVIFIMLILRWCLRACCCNPLPPPVIREPPRRPQRSPNGVRRAAVYTIASDPRGNESTSNFPDFIWDVPPSQMTRSNEPSKDDKDLPSYDEVMRMQMAQQLVEIALTDPNRNRVDPVPVTNTQQPLPSPPVRGEQRI